ncbi:MAG: penicillin-binding protein activator [Hyphomicrobiaceae bacterium]
MSVDARLSRRGLLAASASALLGGCSGSTSNPLASFTGTTQPLTTATVSPPGAAIKIGMLLPLSAPGNAAKLAQDLKQAGELALFEMNRSDIQLLAKDTQGTPDGARAAASAAATEGAELIVGPLFAPEVRSVAAVASPAGIPVVAFSSDRTVAASGVYLLSFMPGDDVRRAVSYATTRGLAPLAALIPATAYGDIVDMTLRETASAAGTKTAVIERFALDAGGMVGPVQRLKAEIESSARSAKAIRAVLISGGQETMPTLAPMLGHYQIGAQSGIQLIGTSSWDYPTVTEEPALQGAWFAAPDPTGWSNFSTRYAKTFGASPARIASLAYDAVSLAIATASGSKGQRFLPSTLTRQSGFAGVDGLFRLRPDGTVERNYAILGIGPGRIGVVDPAPSGFGVAGY